MARSTAYAACGEIYVNWQRRGYTDAATYELGVWLRTGQDLSTPEWDTLSY